MSSHEQVVNDGISELVPPFEIRFLGEWFQADAVAHKSLSQQADAHIPGGEIIEVVSMSPISYRFGYRPTPSGVLEAFVSKRCTRRGSNDIEVYTYNPAAPTVDKIATHVPSEFQNRQFMGQAALEKMGLVMTEIADVIRRPSTTVIIHAPGYTDD